MSTPENVIMVAIERPPDPLLEEILSAEGYEVRHLQSLRHLLGLPKKDSASVAALLMGESASLQTRQLVREIAGRLPRTQIIVSLPDRQGQSHYPEVDPEFAERVLIVRGEVASSDNIDRIRRFLRGEGYRWASELAVAPPDISLLQGPTTLDEKGLEESRLLLRFASDLSRFTELRPMLQEALNRCLDILQCDAGSIYLWNENSETLILEAAVGPERNQRVGLRQRLGEGLAGWVAEVGESILVTDSRKVEKLRDRVCRRYSNFSCLAVPMTHGGQLFGILCLTMPRDNKPFEPKDLQLAQALAQKLAGNVRPLSVLSELRRFSERLIGAFQTSSDMVLQKDAEVESLRALNSNILDSVPHAVIAYDQILRIRSANQVARRLFGLAPDAARANAAAPLEEGLDLDGEVWQRKLLSVIQGAQKVRLQRVAYRHNDRQIMLDLHCSPLRDSSGAVVGGIITAQDVTEDVEMEAKLSSAERLALIGKLAAKVAHELNNPLDGILRFLNLALRQIDQPEKAREYLEESRLGLLRMSNILTELLAFSRSHHAAKRPTSLAQVIHQSLAQYEQRAREAHIKISLDAPPDLPPCPSNEVWEVFGNVVKNALDSMKSDGQLTVKAEPRGDTVRIIVSDTGPGVPAEVKEKIFEPFFTTKKAGLGTGLGLALCRDALRRIGGDIQLLPSDVGATFEITVPTDVQPEHTAP